MKKRRDLLRPFSFSGGETVCFRALVRSRGGTFLLDGCTDQVAPFGPRAVVVPHVLDAEQILQHEPRVRTALTDAAVGNDLFVAGDPLGTIQLLERVEGLERAVFIDGL